MTARTATDSRLPLLLRMAAAVLGGYMFAWGLIALAIPALYAAGMEFHDAEHLASLVALLAYLMLLVGLNLSGVFTVGAGDITAMGAVILHALGARHNLGDR